MSTPVHVCQQTGAAISMLQEGSGLEIDPDPQLEREAEETAQRVMASGELGIQRLGRTDVHVQRQPKTTSDGQITDVIALKEDLEVAGEMSRAVAKEFLKRFIPTEVIAAYDAKQNVEEPSFQDKLQEARFPSEWISDLGDYSPPQEWTDKFREMALKAAKDETGSDNTKF
ncbi:hypothetical protein ACFR99_18490 [Haloarchaeobius amylolyticus]|uniref:Uncharacterized protein n=1 Tax=Haloarchaeobius amylolyticus TaxID=1198296 RepID=A0ABD6BLS0_9EURY